MVEGQILNLPLGVTIGRSVGPIPDQYDPQISIGGAVTRNILGTQWYASDFRVPVGTPPSAGTVHFGPYSTQAQARAQLESYCLQQLDEHGTNGISLWLLL